MKETAHILILVLTLGLFVCNSASGRQKNLAEKSVTLDGFYLTDKQNVKTKQLKKNSDCVRGKAVPIVQKTFYPNTTFILQPDSISAIETVNFDNGDKLIIRNWGCEYYVLTFRFETSRFHQDTTNLEYWFKSADLLMREVSGGIKEGFSRQIENGLSKLNNYVANDQPNNYKSLKLGKEIDFGGNDIRSFVTVDKIEKQTDKKYAVEISFTTGPL